MFSAAIIRPAVKLRGILQLLSTTPRHGKERARKVRQRGEITPKFLELRDREHIFLSMPPSAFHILDRHIGWDAGGDRAHGGGNFLRCAAEVVTTQAEGGQETVDIDPGRQSIVVPELKLGVLARLGQPFEQAAADRQRAPIRRLDHQSAAR